MQISGTTKDFLFFECTLLIILCTFAAVNRFLLRIWLTIAFLCALPETIHGLWEDRVVDHVESTKEESISQHCGLDHHMELQGLLPPAGVVVSAKNSHRIGSSRSIRLMPSHGGKPGRSLGHWASDHSSYLSNLSCLLLHQASFRSQTWAASPRYYYVIALRRILC